MANLQPPSRAALFCCNHAKKANPWLTFSLYVGVAVFVANVYLRFTGGSEATLELFRPLCEVIFVAGVTMTLMAPVRRPDTVSDQEWALSLLGHLFVWLSSYGVAVTAPGLILCFACLLAAVGVYFVTFALGLESWPYPLSPLEVSALCLALLATRVG